MKLSGLSDAHAILFAVQLSINGDVTLLPALQAEFQHALTLELLLRILLTFLPESIAPARYTGVLQSLIDGSVPTPLSEADANLPAIEELSDREARKQVRRLRLLPLRYPAADESSADPLTQFLVHRAHRIDTESGIQPHILELLEPFLSTSQTIRKLAVATVLPLLRFNYEYHPDKEETLSLQLLESLDPRTAVNLLLSKAERRENGGDAARDLRGLVGPWMYGHGKSKRRKLDQEQQPDRRVSLNGGVPGPSGGDDSCGWQDVNEWLLSLSLRDFSLLVETIQHWNGPADVDFGDYGILDEPFSEEEQTQLKQRYGQAALATIYATSEATPDAWAGSRRVLSIIASLFEFRLSSSANIRSDTDQLPSDVPDIDAFANLHRGLLFYNELLQPSNLFTTPTPESVSLLDAILISVHILRGFGYSIPSRDVAELCLFANRDEQLLRFQAVLEGMTHGAASPRNWKLAREQLLWLRGWNDIQDNPRGLFWRVPLDIFEKHILRAILTAKQCELAVELYVNTASPSLSADDVESAVTETIFIAYDNATNGNKTRGGIKRASDMLDTFNPYFPKSTSFRQIKSLISATHSLSFHSLILQHAVPFQPVSIRVHHDPLSLIEKVLEQNPKAYTQLDNLLTIARNFVAAGLPCVRQESKSRSRAQSLAPEQATLLAERRIISHAVTCALQANDFDTAYSYILTHITPPSLISSSPTSDMATVDDEISWRAAYNAGKYRSSKPEKESTSLQAQISHLSRRMELLSLALILSPSPDNLPEILAVWRRCDEELGVLQARESEEAEQWDTRGDQSRLSFNTTSVPGAFGPSDRELDALETAEKRARRSHAVERVRRKGAHEEEAPMGLFDVARGAARAIRKNAFPLSGQAAASSSGSGANKPSSVSDMKMAEAAAAGSASGRSSSDVGRGGEDGQSAEGRVRRRDMVSNIVTGGLASGLGWVLGAQPANANNP